MISSVAIVKEIYLMKHFKSKECKAKKMHTEMAFTVVLKNDIFKKAKYWYCTFANWSKGNKNKSNNLKTILLSLWFSTKNQCVVSVQTPSLLD